jgi:putative spermidine/putrescine transport system permease protein
MSASASTIVSASPWRQWQLLLPLGLFFTTFVLIPLLMLGYVSLHNDTEFKQVGVAQYFKFFSDSFNLGVLGQTLWLAARTTALALLLGFPLAYFFTLSPQQWQRVLILIIVLPLLTSAVVRTFAWVVILGRQGIINQALLGLAWIEAPIKLLYTPSAVVVALAQIEMPLMVLPIINALSRQDPHLREASLSLGAGRWRTLFTITLPLALPGVLAGSLLVFAAAASAFVTQTLVGGGQLMFMPFYIYQQAIQSNNYPFAATIAMVLLVAVLVIVTLINMAGRSIKGVAHA